MRTRWQRPDKTTNEHHASGQGLVELALALPVLLLILLGTVDLGRMFFDYIEMRNAAREAAGWVSRHPDELSAARNKATGHGLPAGAVVTVECNRTASPGCVELKPGESATADVTITSTFTPVAAGFLSTFGLGSIPLRAEASMRVLS